MRSRQLASVVTCLVALALFAGGCGSKSSSTPSPTAAAATATATASSASGGHAATAKAVLHAGLAFGAFRQFIYKPFKAGDLSGSPLSHKAAYLKAGLAGLFAYHELKLAVSNAQASPTLSKLTAPFTALADKLKGVGSSAKSGSVNTASIDSANGDIANVSSTAQSAGASIKDQIPSASQLASGGSS